MVDRRAMMFKLAAGIPVAGVIGSSLHEIPPVFPTAAAKATQSTEVTIEDFGAAGDGQADDTAAFAKYRDYLLAAAASSKQLYAMTLGVDRRYRVLDSINLTGLSDVTVQGNNSAIIGSLAGYPVIDMLGCRTCRVFNLNVFSHDSSRPSSGIQIGRPNMEQGYPQNSFVNVRIEGTFTNAALQNNGSELFSAYDLFLINHYSGPRETYTLIQDGTNHWPTPSKYLDIQLRPGFFVSFNENIFFKPIFYHLGNGGAIWMSGAARHKYERGYCLIQARDKPVVTLYFEPDDTAYRSGQPLLDWDMHSEERPTSIFAIAGGGDVALFGLRYSDHFCQAIDSVFTIAPAIQHVSLSNAYINVAGFLTRECKIFSDPERVHFIGTFASQTADNWTAPKQFSGFVTTDEGMTFTGRFDPVVL